MPQRPEHSQTEQDNLFGHEAVHEQLIWYAVDKSRKKIIKNTKN